MHRENRERLLELLSARGAAGIFPTGSPRIRNADSHYRFRPDSDFFWLTGFDEPDSVLVLRPEGEPRSVLFLPEKDREQEVWSGIRLGTEAAPETLGVDAAHPIEELWERLPELLLGHASIVYPAGFDDERDRQLRRAVESLGREVRKGATAPREWLAPDAFTHELRLFKTEREVALCRRAAEITCAAHRLAMAAAAPGVNEAELDALLEYTFRRRGSTGAAYTNIVAGGANACVLHYVKNDQPLRDGDLLLIDAGAEWNYYAADVTRTFPVNGTFSPAQRELYDVVLRAQKEGIAACVTGATTDGIHELVTRRLVEGLVELGILSGSVDQVLEEGGYRRYYMHRTGHWLGLDVHDCGAYHVDGEPRPLRPGMLQTIEPGLYIPKDDEDVDARWRGVGVRIEDDVLVTEAGNEVLSADAPKEIDEVEEACREADLVTTG
jgi:Xaa-Pro aminopeptidase